jgi:DNA (cytosine-5)-methyltransferase 1
MGSNVRTVKFRFGELFCGPGGLGLAAKCVSVNHDGKIFKIDHAWATDYDKDSCSTYRKNICPNSPDTVVCKDIRKLDFSKLREISEIDCLAFGFPCNDFSVVGEQKGIKGAKVLRKFQSSWSFAENSEGKSFYNSN